MPLSFSGRGLQAYRQTEAQASSPLELVVMLYDGALRFTAEARQAIERGDIPARCTAIDRALADQGRAMAAGSIYFIGPARARLLASGHASI